MRKYTFNFFTYGSQLRNFCLIIKVRLASLIHGTAIIELAVTLVFNTFLDISIFYTTENLLFFHIQARIFIFSGSREISGQT